ncbi:transposable element Tcb1 transposase, partial [Trichonephila clavipes]
ELVFLQEVLPELLTDVPAPIRRCMWFQQNGAPYQYGRSPDLFPQDFFLWGTMKSLVYDTPVNSEMDLEARISIAATTIRETAGIFDLVRQSMLHRCLACINAKSHNFEHHL